MGGEKSLSLVNAVVSWGSPPRGRGKDYSNCAEKLGFGITPAWAGKSPMAGFVLIIGRDHPRVGGEKAIDSIC